MESLALSTFLLMGLSCWVSYFGIANPRFEARHVFWPDAIFGGQYYRVVTSALLHCRARHLFYNMLCLYVFGSGIEMTFGAARFLGLFFGCVIGSGLLALFIHRYDGFYRACGATGGVCGLVVANVLFFPDGSLGRFVPSMAIPSWLYLIAFLAGSCWAGREPWGRADHDGHLGGALTALLAVGIFYPHSASAKPAVAVGLGIALGMMLVFFIKDPSLAKTFSLSRRLRRSGRASIPEPLPRERAEFDLDNLLDKVSQKGLHSLSREEHEFLLETSAKYQRRAESKKPDSQLLF